MLNWFRKKTLEEHLENGTTKKVKVSGIIFTIRKIDPLSFLDGSDAVRSSYELYKAGSVEKSLTEGDIKKLKTHYRDVILAGVVDPVIVRKKTDEGMWVENLFTDWDLVGNLYTEIMLFTHGKKKLK